MNRKLDEDDFFESRLGKDFMDLEEIQKQMGAMQVQFLERYGHESEEPENKQM